MNCFHECVAMASNSLGCHWEILVPIWWTKPWRAINQQMLEYWALGNLSLNSLHSAAALIITNLEETAIRRCHDSNMWCSNCSSMGCRTEAGPSKRLFTFLFRFSCIMAISLFQLMNCLWWRLEALQAARILRLFTSRLHWSWQTAAIFSYKLNWCLFPTYLLGSSLSISLCPALGISLSSSSSSSSTGSRHHWTPSVWRVQIWKSMLIPVVHLSQLPACICERNVISMTCMYMKDISKTYSYYLSPFTKVMFKQDC